jgi:hypothetical protein
MQSIGANPNDWDRHFKLVADIDMYPYGPSSYNIIGNETTQFVGTFEGNGHKITSLIYYEYANVHYIGLFGYVGAGGKITNLGLEGINIDAYLADYVGGLAGYNNGRLASCHAAGNVEGDFWTGGLVGHNDGTITDCKSGVTVSGNSQTGGLVGRNDANVNDCNSNGTVEGSNQDEIGGLVGHNTGTIMYSYSNSTVVGTDGVPFEEPCCDIRVGGLVGYNSGTVAFCYATGSVSANQAVGGLIGANIGLITHCWATGNASAIGASGTGKRAGGLVGMNFGRIVDCYSQGSVFGDEEAGGLVGANWEDNSAVSNAYSASPSVSGTTNIGGLMGRNFGGTIESSFWDAQLCGLGNTCGLEDGGGSGCNDANGLTTAEMMTESTFTDAGWDFVEVWDIGENQTYPFLRIYPAGDLNHDGIVNMLDFAILALHWLEGTEP